jgi:hypothetical protein
MLSQIFVFYFEGLAFWIAGHRKVTIVLLQQDHAEGSET